MTFSVTKTYLALVAGVAFDQGLIKDLDECIHKSLPGIGFDSPHNDQITWRHMLQFTSEWEGTCFGIPDQVDRFRQVAVQGGASSQRKGEARELQNPGTYWEYNDIRINQFSLALLHLFQKPLPEVLAEHIMQPLGCSNTWQWHGYENSWVTIETNRQTREIQSVPGGGHWGGGMVISAADQSRVARLLLNGGEWKQGTTNQRLLSRQWVEAMKAPCDIAPFYGFFTWLNDQHCVSRHAPEDAFFAFGVGGQYILHDPQNQLIGVYRWLDADAFPAVLELTYELLQG